MHDFMSAIVLKGGDLVCVPELTDCHDDLIKYAGVDAAECVRLWFVPPNAKGFFDPDRYELTVAQPTVPEWFDPQTHSRTEDALRDRVRAMIITDTRPVIRSGCWIVAPHGYVGDLVAGRIVHVAPGGVVRNVLNDAVVDDVHGTVINVRLGGVVHNVREGGTVINVWGTINNVLGVVGDVRDGGRVTNLWRGQVVHVCKGGTVDNVWGTVGIVYGVIGTVREGGRVDELSLGGLIHNVQKGGTVDNVWPRGVIRSGKPDS